METWDRALIAVIASHATTKVTLDLLTSFEPRLAYRVSTWKQKTLVESRGLVLDSIGVGDSWWAYYLLKNRTLYGVILDIEHTDNGWESSIMRRNALIYHRMVGCIFDNTGVYQLPDLSISIGNKMFLFDRKIRDTIDYESNGLFILDEYGDVWLYRQGGDSGSIHAFALGFGIVQMINDNGYGITKSGLLGLTRDGRLVVWHERTNKVSFFDDVPKTVHYTRIFDWRSKYPGILTLSNGDHVYVNPNRGSTVRDTLTTTNIGRDIAQYRIKYDSIEKVPFPIPNSALIIAGWGENKKVYTTNDRTVHVLSRKYGDDANDYVSHRTAHLTQYVDPTSYSHHIYAIIDPK